MKGKRILSAVLSAALLLQLSPLAVFAEDTSLLPVTAQTALTEPAPEEPAPEETAVPMAAPTPEPTAEPTATPAEESAPDAAETPAPEPSAEPTAAPDPAAEVQALINALPDEVTEDNAEAVEQALTDIDDAKQSLTDEELAGLDLTRYDAAANALLALWGEATTDAVEMLDIYATPTPGSDGYYSIADAGDLDWFASQVNYGNNTIKAKLTQDITVNNGVLNEDGSLTANFSSLKEWTPIGTNTNPFTGTFDGNGHTISGLYCDTPEGGYVGLFGKIDGGEVRHLGVVDSYFAGDGSVGGVCGYNNGTISGCYSTATVSSALYTGGVLFGYSMRTVENSFAYGHPQGNARSLGTIQGRSVTNCFYLYIRDENYPKSVKAASAEEFKSGMVAYELGLKDPCWKQDLNSSAIYHSFTGQSVGKYGETYHNHTNEDDCKDCIHAKYNLDKTTDGKYKITSKEELKWFANEVNNFDNTISVLLMNDIPMDSTEWTPIGKESQPFTGTFDGDGHTISGLKCTDAGAYYVGLVGYAVGATIKNVTVKDSAFNGDEDIGAVCGFITGGTITGCTNSGSTENGGYRIGGIVGFAGNKTTVQRCFNTGKVTGQYGRFGGIVGYAYDATVQNCGNTGAVKEADGYDGVHYGGIIGLAEDNSTIQNCYNADKNTAAQMGR